LSAEEEAWLKAGSLPEATALLLLWTAREALGKALGCGLACEWKPWRSGKSKPPVIGVWRGRSGIIAVQLRLLGGAGRCYRPRLRCVETCQRQTGQTVRYSALGYDPSTFTKLHWEPSCAMALATLLVSFE
jgi:hypothetical protein